MARNFANQWPASPVRVSTVILCVFALLAAGCESSPEVHVSAPPTTGPNFFRVGTSVEGRPIECQVLGDGPEVVFIIASIHGDETAGSPLVRQLSDYLQMNPHRLSGRRVVLLPAVNPDGMVLSSRENANGVDLNRNFPAGNREDSDRHGWAELSEPESQVIAMLIDLYHPSRVIAIHQPLACVDYDGPAQALAARIAKHTKLPVKQLGTRPGSMGAFLGDELGIPTITLELPRGVDKWNEARLWEAYGDAMIACVVFPDSVQSELVTRPLRSKSASATPKSAMPVNAK